MQLPSLHWKPPMRGEQRGHVTERRAVIGHLEAGRLLLAGEALGAGGGGDQPQRQQQQYIQHDGLIHSLCLMSNELWKMVCRPGLYIP